jgi:hypothetical protein
MLLTRVRRLPFFIFFIYFSFFFSFFFSLSQETADRLHTVATSSHVRQNRSETIHDDSPNHAYDPGSRSDLAKNRGLHRGAISVMVRSIDDTAQDSAGFPDSKVFSGVTDKNTNIGAAGLAHLISEFSVLSDIQIVAGVPVSSKY